MSLINSSGFKYRMESLNISEDNLLVAYDFVSGQKFSDGYLDNTYWATGSILSGKINGDSSDFYKNNGSGFFNGSDGVFISGSIPSDDFVFMFCYEKAETGNAVLLSSSDGVDQLSSSGLVFGVNDANKLFIEYWGPDSNLTSLSYPKEVSSKNMVFLRKSFGEFSLGVFNPIDSRLSSVSKAVDNRSYTHSDSFTIGSGKSSFWTRGGAFHGYIDDFYCLTGVVPDDYLINLFSGFYSIPTGGEISGTYLFCENVSTLTGSGVIVGTGITGYETVVTYETGFVPSGYFESGYIYSVGSGITGYEEKYIGEVQDSYGQSYPIYVRSPLSGEIYITGVSGYYSGQEQVLIPIYENVELTGTITGEAFFPIDVEICTTQTGYHELGLSQDSGFIKSLGFDSVYSFYRGNNNSIFELFFYTGDLTNRDLNQKSSFDLAESGWKLQIDHSGFNQNLFFKNGQLLIETSGFSYYDGGQIKYNIPGDVFVDGLVVRSNETWHLTDRFIYDNSNSISGEWSYLPTGFSQFSNFNYLFDSSYADYSLFLNGVKLVRDLDYSSSNIFYDIPPSSVLFKINNNYISDENLRITGSQNVFSLTNLGRFTSDSSQLYINGLRQSLNEDYIEVSSLSLLSGNPIVQTYKNRLVLSSSSDFWNI